MADEATPVPFNPTAQQDRRTALAVQRITQELADVEAQGCQFSDDQAAELRDRLAAVGLVPKRSTRK